MKKFILFVVLSLMSANVYAKNVTNLVYASINDRSILNSSDYYWNDIQSNNPLFVKVNLTTQMAYVYRGDTLIGVTNVSSGRPGFDTPTGTFKILGKEDNHHSKHYDADMPFTMWLNNDGVALHSGSTPGRPSSHGCVHLPFDFAQLLYAVADQRMTVEILYSNEVDGLRLNLPTS